MPGFDVSANVISLFAFILVLGIIAIFRYQEGHGDALRSSIKGAREIEPPTDEEHAKLAPSPRRSTRTATSSDEASIRRMIRTSGDSPNFRLMCDRVVRWRRRWLRPAPPEHGECRL